MKRRSIPVLLDLELVARFGSPEAINAALRIVVDAAQRMSGRSSGSASKTMKISPGLGSGHVRQQGSWVG